MPCFRPIKGWLSKKRSPKGKRQVVFTISEAYTDRGVTIPCGQCSGCRLERSRQWAIRCHHEATLYEDNCFLTLTYDDQHLPDDYSVSVRPLQLFMKALRNKYSPKRIRFYACGEYGDKYGRPHYHLLLFNHDFSDKTLWKNDRDDPLYRSESLEKLWPFGHSSIGNVTFQSAGYVARYIMKKISGDDADEHYGYIDPDDPEKTIHQRKPEFTVMSRKPGIGQAWFKKWTSDIYPSDEIIIEGKKMRPPRYYDQSFEISEPQHMRKIKWTRLRNLNQHKENNTPERLVVREIILEKKIAQLQRNHDLEG